MIMKVEHHKISKRLSDSTMSKFVTTFGRSTFGQHSISKNIRLLESYIPILRLDLSAYRDGYIVVKEGVTFTGIYHKLNANF